MKKVLLMSCFFTTLSIFAQRELIVIDRNAAPSKKSSSQEDDFLSEKWVQHTNVYKFDAMRLIIGDIALSYERVIGQKTSLELELGPTLSNLGMNRFTLQDDNSINGSKNTSMGGFGSLAIRFYPLDGRPALNQFYISPKFKYRQYNEIFSPSAASALDDRKGFSKQNIFSFNFGMQQWVAKQFALDYYVGIGIGHYVDRSSRPNSYYDGVSNEWKEEWLDKKTNSANVVLSIGIKCGIGN
jgi:putative salt-induced outer membrane protein YdiY